MSKQTWNYSCYRWGYIFGSQIQNLPKKSICNPVSLGFFIIHFALFFEAVVCSTFSPLIPICSNLNLLEDSDDDDDEEEEEVKK